MSSPNYGKQLRILNSETGHTLLCSGNALLLHIIDDVNFVCFGWHDDDVLGLYSHCKDNLVSNGLPIGIDKSSPEGTVEKHTMPFIGWDWYLQTNTIRPRLKKFIDACDNLSRLQREIRICRKELESVCGKLVRLSLGLRPLLSVLHRTFHFLHDNLTPQQASNTEPAVRKELALLKRLLPISAVHLTRDLWHTVIAFDASNVAGAVVYTRATSEELSALLSSIIPPTRRPHRYRMAVTSVINALQIASEQHELPNPQRQSPLEDKKVARFVETHQWTVAFQHRWRRGAHINSLEASTAVLALRWAVSHSITNHRMFLLSDSMVTIGALMKGRSSSPRLLLQCRQFGAIQMAHNVQPLFIYVPSEINPADGPSRFRARRGALL